MAKKCHTVKTVVISSPDRHILFVSNTWLGKEHDYTLLKEEFPPSANWFENFELHLDSGYQGFEKDYKRKKCYIPQKKKRNSELSAEQKAENKELAKERIRVEHSIGGLKRYRISSDRARIRDYQLFDQIIGVFSGLWNYMKIDAND